MALTLIIVGVLMVTVGICYFAFPVASKIVFTENDLNACAAEAAFAQYLRENGGNHDQAAASLAVDGYQNILATARAYNKRFGGGGLKTVYEVWAEQAPAICLKHKLAGEPIAMPKYGPPKGYHIARSAIGSAAIVKDGDAEPAFGCVEGFHSTGRPWQPDGSGGCQPN